MAMCEKCWSDAFFSSDQARRYQQLVEDRQGARACPPEMQAGHHGRWCPRCERHTVHEIVGTCTVGFCGYSERATDTEADR